MQKYQNLKIVSLKEMWDKAPNERIRNYLDTQYNLGMRWALMNRDNVVTYCKTKLRAMFIKQEFKRQGEDATYLLYEQ